MIRFQKADKKVAQMLIREETVFKNLQLNLKIIDHLGEIQRMTKLFSILKVNKKEKENQLWVQKIIKKAKHMKIMKIIRKKMMIIKKNKTRKRLNQK